ncbi:class I SAM-dependent methyltransferase [Chloroflexota bacterium]
MIVAEEKSYKIHQHFSKIADKYHQIRTTDVDPIKFIVRRIRNLKHIKAIDVGCGDGRYDLLLYKYLGSKLRLTCADSNPDMLNSLVKNLTNHGIADFNAVNYFAETITSQDNIYDCVFTFNAIHHFNLRGFLSESARILKAGGYIFIYTRLRDQNRRSIWGRYFPFFHHKETRLFTLDKLVRTIKEVPGLHLKTFEFFKYGRKSNLKQLVEQARSYHYSTFDLYSSQEFEEAIKGFTGNIRATFKNDKNVHWFDENLLLVVNKE